MSSIKIERINAELVRTISSILMNEARDKLLHTITITGVDTAKDLSFAKVYFTSLSDLSKQDLEKELEEASDFLRKEVAMKLDLRQTPKLKFIYDESIEYGTNIEKKLKEIKDSESN